MARALSAAGFSMMLVLSVLAHQGEAQGSQPPPKKNTLTQAGQPAKQTAKTPASKSAEDKLFGLGGNTRLFGNPGGTIGANVGANIGGSVGGFLGSVLNPLTSLTRPLWGNAGNPAQPQPTYQQPQSPPTLSQSNNVGWASYIPSTSSVPGITYDQCNAQWRTALLKEAMNYDDWRCSARLTAAGSSQPCVLTGAVGSSPTPQVVTTGCGWTMPLFCDDTVNDVVTSLRASQLASANPIPPVGYTAVAGVGYYRVHTELRTWADAKLACEQDGASVGTHLAVPSTAADYAAIMNLLAAAGVTNVATTAGAYVGISDIAQEGYYQSVTGQPICTLGQVLFAALQPNGGSAENCITLGQNQAATLNDVVCTNLLPFVCEMTLPSRVTTTCR